MHRRWIFLAAYTCSGMAGLMRNRGKMLMAAGAPGEAYADFARALTRDPTDRPSLAGLVDSALVTQREADAQAVLEGAAAAAGNPFPWIALSRLFATTGRTDDALKTAIMAGRIAPDAPECLEQLASVYADAGDAQMLPIAAERIRRLFPSRPSGHCYAAAAADRNFGLLELASGNKAAAAKLFAEALAIDPTSAASQQGLAEATLIDHP